MKKTLIISIIFLLPIMAMAVEQKGVGGLVGCTSDPCTLADLIGVIGRWIDFAIKNLIVPLAILAFLYAGILYVTSPADSGNVGKAKGIMLDAVYGIVFALAAYLIVQAVTQALGGQNPEQYLKGI